MVNEVQIESRHVRKSKTDGSCAAWQARASEAAAYGGGRPSHRAAKGMVNEVVCGAMMLAYERAGRWQNALGMLERAERLGIAPNTVMLNTALSALAKAGRASDAAALFARVPAPDATSFKTLIAAHGLAGEPRQAEAVFASMLEAGFPPRDYAYCGLVAAHSLAGDARAALHVRARMRLAGVPPSVHVFNSLIAACERASYWCALARSLLYGQVCFGQVPCRTSRLWRTCWWYAVSCVSEQVLAVPTCAQLTRMCEMVWLRECKCYWRRSVIGQLAVSLGSGRITVRMRGPECLTTEALTEITWK